MRGGPSRLVCLSAFDTTDAVTELKCAQSAGGTEGGAPQGGALQDLSLQPGSYLITVTGEASLLDSYTLRIDSTSSPAPDFETEPNDTPATAVPMAPTTAMRGAALSGDPDVFRVVTAGDAQAWTVQVTGAQLDGLAWLADNGIPIAVGEVVTDRSMAVLSDAFLPAGDHLFQVTSDGGAYTLTLTPQGPPDQGAETEPNNDSTRAQPLVLDTPITGRLPETGDVDVYRFSLTAVEHIHLLLTAPADGVISATLLSSGVTVAGQFDPVPGQGWDYDALMQPGDYELWLKPQTPSRSPYELRIGREDPFAVREDQEPNDGAWAARPMPPSLAVHGSRDGSGDQDWFRFEPLAQPGTMVLRATGGVIVLGVSDGTNELPVSEAPDGEGRRFSVGPLPGGVPLYLHILPSGDYTVAVVSGVPPPTGPAIPAPALDARLSLTLPDTSVAAYWDAGQHLTGTLTVADTGTVEETLTLDAVTSHYAWTAGLASTSVSVSPGQSVVVPVSIDVLPDAWADIPVRITVRARDASGAQATGYAEDYTPGGPLLPVDPHRAWSVPDALLGGLDVAALALGGAPVPSVDPALEAHLYDGVEHSWAPSRRTGAGSR